MNIEDAHITLTPELMELIKKRNDNKSQKEKFVRSRNYEEAARCRDIEKNITQSILELLQTQNDFDFSKSKRIQRDLMLILSKVEETDFDFSKAVKKLQVKDLERMRLIKSIHQYINGQINIDLLHDAVDNSFERIEDDLKKRIIAL